MVIVFSFLPALLWLLLALKHLYARRTNSARGRTLGGSWRFSSRRRAQGAYYMSNPFLLLLPLFSGFSLFFIASITKSGLIGILFPGWAGCFFVIFMHTWNERHAPFLKLYLPSRAALRRTYVAMCMLLLGGADTLALLILWAGSIISFQSFLLALVIHGLHLFLLAWAAATLLLAAFPQKTMEQRNIAIALFATPSFIILLVPFYFVLFHVMYGRRIKESMDWSQCPYA